MVFIFAFVLLASQLITNTLSSTCRAVYYQGHPIVPLDVCSNKYTATVGLGGQIYKCWNGTFVVEEWYTTTDCTGESDTAFIAYNASQHTFDCYNEELCEYAMVRSYIDSTCQAKGSYDDTPIVVNQCSYDINKGISTKYVCTETAVEEYTYNATNCNGDTMKRQIIYQNGDCDEQTNGYLQIAECGDFKLDQDDSCDSKAVIYTLAMIVLMAIFQMV